MVVNYVIGEDENVLGYLGYVIGDDEKLSSFDKSSIYTALL